MNGKGYLIAAVVLLLSGPAAVDMCAVGDERAPRQLVNIVDIEIAEDSVDMDVSFNGSSSAVLRNTASLKESTFSGRVIDHVDVILTEESPDYLGVVLSVYEFTLSPEEPALQFTANVTITPGSSSSLSPVVTVDGTATVYFQSLDTQGGVAEDSVDVNILPFYGGELEFQQSFGKVVQGDERTFQLTVRNTGNAGDRFHLFISNSDELKEGGIKVTLESDTVDVPEGGSADLDVKVEAERDAKRGSTRVIVATYSEEKGPGDPEESRGILSLTVERRGFDIITGLFSSPVYLWLTLAVLLILGGALAFGAYRLREHLSWRRMVRDMRRKPPAD